MAKPQPFVKPAPPQPQSQDEGVQAAPEIQVENSEVVQAPPAEPVDTSEAQKGNDDIPQTYKFSKFN